MNRKLCEVLSLAYARDVLHQEVNPEAVFDKHSDDAEFMEAARKEMIRLSSIQALERRDSAGYQNFKVLKALLKDEEYAAR